MGNWLNVSLNHGFVTILDPLCYQWWETWDCVSVSLTYRFQEVSLVGITEKQKPLRLNQNLYITHIWKETKWQSSVKPAHEQDFSGPPYQLTEDGFTTVKCNTIKPWLGFYQWCDLTHCVTNIISRVIITFPIYIYTHWLTLDLFVDVFLWKSNGSFELGITMCFYWLCSCFFLTEDSFL